MDTVGDKMQRDMNADNVCQKQLMTYSYVYSVISKNTFDARRITAFI